MLCVCAIFTIIHLIYPELNNKAKLLNWRLMIISISLCITHSSCTLTFDLRDALHFRFMSLSITKHNNYTGQMYLDV